MFNKESHPVPHTSDTDVIELFSAVCACCGQEAQVPIKDIGADIVYCLGCILNGQAPPWR